MSHSSLILQFPDTILQIAKMAGPAPLPEEFLSTVFETVHNSTVLIAASNHGTGEYFCCVRRTN